MPLLRPTPSRVVVLAVALLAAGCGTHHYWVSRFVKHSIEMHAPELHLAKCWARVDRGWLEVELEISSPDTAYRSDLLLEEAYARLGTIAVARSEEVFEQAGWHIFKLTVRNRYGTGFRWRNRFGMYVLTMPREGVQRIRDGGIDPGAVPLQWHRLTAAKQDGSKELIEWPEDADAPQWRRGK